MSSTMPPERPDDSSDPEGPYDPPANDGGTREQPSTSGYTEPAPSQPQYGEPQASQPQASQPQYGQPQYGQPVPAGFGDPAAAPRNGLGTAALIVGILALILAILFFPLGLILALVAIGLGIAGRRRAKTGQATNGGMATGGLVLGVVSLLIAIALAVFVGSLFNRVKECTDPNLTQAQRQTCVNEKVQSG